MWWSPDSRKVAYYRFDEKRFPTTTSRSIRRRFRARTTSRRIRRRARRIPIVDLFVYDVASKKSTKVDVRNGKPFDNDVVGHYVYRVAWSRGRHASCSSTAPTASRTSSSSRRRTRRPARPASIVREEWPTGWIENSPSMTFLKDGRRFIWESERNGWSNFYLYDLSGKLIAPLTTHTGFEVGSLAEGRRGGGRHLLHRSRRRQLHEDAAAPRRSGRREGRAADRSAFNHTVAGCMGTAGGGGGRGGSAPPAADAASRRTTATSSTSIRRTTRRRQPGSSMPRGKVVAELAKSDLTKSLAARIQARPRCSPTPRPTERRSCTG